MSKNDEYIVTVHVEPDCSPETLLALNDMVKCLIKHMEQRSPTLREAVAPSMDGGLWWICQCGAHHSPSSTKCPLCQTPRP